MRSAIIASDLVIVPTSPTSDIDAAVVDKMIKLFDESKEFNKKSKALITLSRATPNVFLGKKIDLFKAYLSGLLRNQHGIYLLKSVLHEREAFNACLSAVWE